MHTSLDPDEVLAATNIAKEFNVEVTVDHSFGSQMVAEKLAEANIPVIAGPLMIAMLSPMYRYISMKSLPFYHPKVLSFCNDRTFSNC
jgi:hypothetical protein